MVRQWQEFFYERNYAATPLLNPDFAKLGEAYGIRSMTVSERSQVVPSVQAAREHDGPVLINFRVEQEDTVYPMVAAGAPHYMIGVLPNDVGLAAARSSKPRRTK